MAALFFTRGLDYDKEIILIGGNHHLVAFASDSEESEVVRWVKIPDEVAGLSR